MPVPPSTGPRPVAMTEGLENGLSLVIRFMPLIVGAAIGTALVNPTEWATDGPFRLGAHRSTAIAVTRRTRGLPRES